MTLSLIFKVKHHGINVFFCHCSIMVGLRSVIFEHVHHIVDTVIAIYSVRWNGESSNILPLFLNISHLHTNRCILTVYSCIFQQDKLNKIQRVSLMRSCECVCRFQLYYSCVRPGGVSPPPRRPDVRRPGGWTTAAPASGRPPPRRLDVRRPSGWTSAAPTAGRSPPQRLGGLKSAAPAVGRPPPQRMDVHRSGGWTSAAPAAARPLPRRRYVCTLYYKMR